MAETCRLVGSGIHSLIVMLMEVGFEKNGTWRWRMWSHGYRLEENMDERLKVLEMVVRFSLPVVGLNARQRLLLWCDGGYNSNTS